LALASGTRVARRRAEERQREHSASRRRAMSGRGPAVSEALRSGLKDLRSSVIERVSNEVRKSSVHATVSNASIETALEQAIEEALSVDVIDVLAGGWKRWGEVQEKAIKSRSDDGRYVVPLVEHSIDIAYKPAIEVVLNEVRVAEIVLGFDVTFELSGFRLTLKRGALIAVDAGECSSSAKLKASDTILWSGSLGQLTLPVQWTLDPPVQMDGFA